ncbi:MAG: hypothetical protein ACKOW9_02185 [Candidatus Paceibacterota bacterium]
MPKPLTWPEIKEQYPILAAKLISGDIPSRVEFARLAFGATLIKEESSNTKEKKLKRTQKNNTSKN